MSTRTSLRPHPVIVAKPMTADIISDPTILQSITSVSYTAYWSGTSPIGALAVEVCNDCQVLPDGEIVANTGHWVPVALTDDTGALVTSIPISGNSGQKFINVTKIAGYAIRLHYIFTSGTGTLDAIVCGKVS